MPGFIVTSLVLSLVLTLALNLAPRVFPNATRRIQERIRHAQLESTQYQRDDEASPRIRYFFPWKAMLILSVVLTVVLNVVAVLTN